MTDLRGERVDEGKVWAACPRCRGGAMDLIETWRLAESVRQGVERLADENAALRAEVARLREAVEWALGQPYIEADELRRRAGRGDG